MTNSELADELERLALDQSAKHQEWLHMGDEAYGQQFDAAQARLCLFVSEHRDAILTALRAAPEGWRPMDTAPEQERFLMSRAGRVTIGWQRRPGETQKWAPYWSGYDENTRGTRWARQTQPDGWMPLPAPIPRSAEPPP